MSICFTRFPVRILGQTNIYQNRGDFSTIWGFRSFLNERMDRFSGLGIKIKRTTCWQDFVFWWIQQVLINVVENESNMSLITTPNSGNTYCFRSRIPNDLVEPFWRIHRVQSIPKMYSQISCFKSNKNIRKNSFKTI